MNGGQEKGARAADPFEPFRTIRDAYLDTMARTMVDAVNTEAYAQATGAMLDSYLSAAEPVREAVEKSMVQALQQLSLPSRQELAALAERFTNLEMRLDDMDAKLDVIHSLLRHARPATKPEAEGAEATGPAASTATGPARRQRARTQQSSKRSARTAPR